MINSCIIVCMILMMMFLFKLSFCYKLIFNVMSINIVVKNSDVLLIVKFMCVFLIC